MDDGKNIQNNSLFLKNFTLLVTPPYGIIDRLFARHVFWRALGVTNYTIFTKTIIEAISKILNQCHCETFFVEAITFLLL